MSSWAAKSRCSAPTTSVTMEEVVPLHVFRQHGLGIEKQVSTYLLITVSWVMLVEAVVGRR